MPSRRAGVAVLLCVALAAAYSAISLVEPLSREYEVRCTGAAMLPNSLRRSRAPGCFCCSLRVQGGCWRQGSRELSYMVARWVVLLEGQGAPLSD